MSGMGLTKDFGDHCDSCGASTAWLSSCPECGKQVGSTESARAGRRAGRPRLALGEMSPSSRARGESQTAVAAPTLPTAARPAATHPSSTPGPRVQNPVVVQLPVGMGNRLTIPPAAEKPVAPPQRATTPSRTESATGHAPCHPETLEKPTTAPASPPAQVAGRRPAGRAATPSRTGAQEPGPTTVPRAAAPSSAQPAVIPPAAGKSSASPGQVSGGHRPTTAGPVADPHHVADRKPLADPLRVAGRKPAGPGADSQRVAGRKPAGPAAEPQRVAGRKPAGPPAPPTRATPVRRPTAASLPAHLARGQQPAPPRELTSQTIPEDESARASDFSMASPGMRSRAVRRRRLALAVSVLAIVAAIVVMAAAVRSGGAGSPASSSSSEFGPAGARFQVVFPTMPAESTSLGALGGYPFVATSYVDYVANATLGVTVYPLPISQTPPDPDSFLRVFLGSQGEGAYFGAPGTSGTTIDGYPALTTEFVAPGGVGFTRVLVVLAGPVAYVVTDSSRSALLPDYSQFAASFSPVAG